jgi:hypothetical protein
VTAILPPLGCRSMLPTAAREKDLRPIFDDARRDVTVTVAEQRQFRTQWFESLGKQRDFPRGCCPGAYEMDSRFGPMGEVPFSGLIRARKISAIGQRSRLRRSQRIVLPLIKVKNPYSCARPGRAQRLGGTQL